MKYFVFICLALLAATLPGLGGDDGHFDFDWAGDSPKWHSTVSGEFKAGNERHLSRMDFTMPLYQTEDSLFFFNFQGWIDDDQNDEINVGLAHRWVLDDKIFGVYGFFDRRHSFHTRNQFDQVTLGAEILGEQLDHRFNVYLPTSMNGQATGTGTSQIRGNQLFLSGLEERPYRGFDYEIGALLNRFGENDNELRLFGGAYYFNNEAALFNEAIAGPRLRLEMRLFDLDLLGEGSRVTLSGEVQWDEIRDTQGFGGIAVQIPIGRWGKNGGGGRSASPFGANNAYSSLSRLERRMYDPIVRDDDIVTNTSGEELALDAEGDPLLIAYSATDLDEQITNVGENGTVIVNGQIDTEGQHRLLEGQRLAGGDSVQGVTGASSGQKVTGRLPGEPGFLNNSLPTATVFLADNVTVDSLSFAGGLAALQGISVKGVEIRNNTIDVKSGNLGIVSFVEFDGTIHNNTITGDPSNAIQIGTNKGTISGNRIILDGFTNSGFFIGENSGTISDNRVIGAAFAYSVGINDGIITRNLADGNSQGAFRISTNNGTISSNVARGSGADGFLLNTNSATGVIAGNTAIGSTEDGFQIFLSNDGIFRDNQAFNNTQAGYNINVNNNLPGTFNNTGSGNGSNNTAP